MAVTQTTRMALTRWSAGTDPFTRAQMDDDHAQLEGKAAGFLRGTKAAMPAADATNVGFLYEATDENNTLYWSTGGAWVHAARQIAQGLMADFTTSPGAFPEGVSVASMNSGLAGAPDATTPLFVVTFRHGASGVYQIATARDSSPTDAVYAKWERIGYVGGTPEWSPWMTPGQQATKTVRIPHTWHVPGEVKVASGDTDYILPMTILAPTGKSVIYQGIRGRISSGTSVSIYPQRNLTGNLFGTGTLTVGTGGGENTGTSNGTVLTHGDTLRFVVSAVSGTPKNLSVTIDLDYTF